MRKSKYNVIGVMSGTSLDGIDLAIIEFWFNEIWSFRIIKAETIDYSKQWKESLKNLVSKSANELTVVDQNYTVYLSSVINDFTYRNRISHIDAVCSHGHTALHQPEKGITFQIGNREELSKLIGKTVVCNFRVQDIQLGGQGAPLVPIGDELLFPNYDFCLNLGGFANVSTKINSIRIAYDICPVNIVLNHYVNQLGLDYDDKGKIGSLGKIHLELLNSLNSLEFYQKKHPKSLGLEWVKTEILPLVDAYNLQVKDILRTFVEHISTQITNEINKKAHASVLITGGGVYNDFLIKRIKAKTKNEIVIPDQSTIEFKEALVFGFLGVLKLRNEVNCLSSVTGANKDHSSGHIYYP
jgi:anhydro-N-acetylmuramic acid kinase